MIQESIIIPVPESYTLESTLQQSPLSVVSVTCGKLQSKDIKQNIPKINLNYTPSELYEQISHHHALSHAGLESFPCPEYPLCIPASWSKKTSTVKDP